MFRVRKFLWLSIFWVNFLGFLTVIPILFTPKYPLGFDGEGLKYGVFELPQKNPKKHLKNILKVNRIRLK